jgi:hypothetical protein
VHDEAWQTRHDFRKANKDAGKASGASLAAKQYDDSQAEGSLRIISLDPKP